MSKLTIGITTASRGTDYLSGVLAGIPDWADVVIAPSGRTHFKSEKQHTVLEPNCDIAGRMVPLEKNHDRLIDVLAEKDDVFLTLQDDVLPCVNAYERVAQVADWIRSNPRVAFVSFYTPYAQCGTNRVALWPYNAGFYGELAVLWNKAAALDFTSRDYKGVTEHDLAIQAHFSHSNRWICAGHSPCLFQHIGVDSSIGNQWEKRVTMNWTEEHDAIKDAKSLSYGFRR